MAQPAWQAQGAHLGLLEQVVHPKLVGMLGLH